jgi:Glycosyl transferases group 1
VLAAQILHDYPCTMQHFVRREAHMQKRSVLRQQLNVTDSHVLVSLMGTVCARKAQLAFIAALPTYFRTVPDMKERLIVLLIGTSHPPSLEETAIRHFVDQHALTNNVRYILKSTQASGMLHAVDFHWSNSKMESFPLNVLEAMAMGVPIVSTDIFGVAEMVPDNPSGGLLYTPTDSEGVALVLQKALNTSYFSTAQQAAKVAYEHVKHRFTNTAADHKWKKLVATVEHNPEVCFIVRTFVHHLHHDFYDLQRMLKSLQQLNNPDWVALLVNTDTAPMHLLPRILAALDDPRIQALTALPSQSYSSDNAAYTLTDEAIMHCPDSNWLVVTNGDNLLQPAFLDHLNLNYDIIAVDFYSRYMHIYDGDVFGRGCARFAGGMCKHNTAQLYHTDLGANILNLARWRCEGVRFDRMAGGGSQDGQTIANLVYWGWKVQHVYECLMHHNPNPISCNMLGGTWHDSSASCLTADEAQSKIAQGAIRVIPTPGLTACTE